MTEQIYYLKIENNHIIIDDESINVDEIKSVRGKTYRHWVQIAFNILFTAFFMGVFSSDWEPKWFGAMFGLMVGLVIAIMGDNKHSPRAIIFHMKSGEIKECLIPNAYDPFSFGSYKLYKMVKAIDNLIK